MSGSPLSGVSKRDRAALSGRRSLQSEPEVMSPITKQAYTPEEVAKLLGLHPNSVYQMLKNGDLPGIKAGRKWLISKRRFHGWLDGEDR